MSLSLGVWVGQCVAHLTLKLGVRGAVFLPEGCLPSPFSLSFPARRSADPLVPQMLFGSWCAAVSAGPPWRPYPHRGRAGRTGPEVRQPHTPQSAGVWPLLHGDLKGPPAPSSGAGDRSGISLMVLAPAPGTLDPAEKPTIFLGWHHQAAHPLPFCSQHTTLQWPNV